VTGPVGPSICTQSTRRGKTRKSRSSHRRHAAAELQTRATSGPAW